LAWQYKEHISGKEGIELREVPGSKIRLQSYVKLKTKIDVTYDHC